MFKCSVSFFAESVAPLLAGTSNFDLTHSFPSGRSSICKQDYTVHNHMRVWGTLEKGIETERRLYSWTFLASAGPNSRHICEALVLIIFYVINQDHYIVSFNSVIYFKLVIQFC